MKFVVKRIVLKFFKLYFKMISNAWIMSKLLVYDKI